MSKLDSLQSGMDEMATALPLPIAWHGARELLTANRDSAYATFRSD